MTDIVIETLRAIIVGGIVLFLLRLRHAKEVTRIDGWWTLVAGFALVFFGTLIDITDNFEELGRFVIIGDTEIQAFLEKVVGYLLGFLLLALGIFRWLPKLIEHGELTRKNHAFKIQEERLKVLQATMRTVQDIVGNFLQSLQLIRLKAEQENGLDLELLTLMDTTTQETAAKLKRLGDLNSTPETQLAGGIGIDFEKSSSQDCTPAANQKLQMKRETCATEPTS